MSETKETVVHTLGTEWRGENTWRATCSCGWRGANSKSGGADQDKARHRRDAEVFADTYGVILQRGDEVRAKLTGFDGPPYLSGKKLIVKSLGRTKVTVTSPENHGERAWALAAASLELVERSKK